MDGGGKFMNAASSTHASLRAPRELERTCVFVSVFSDRLLSPSPGKSSELAQFRRQVAWQGFCPCASLAVGGRGSRETGMKEES